MEAFFDTETSGLPSTTKPLHDVCQPHIIQLGFCLSDKERVYLEGNLILNPSIYTTDLWSIHPKAEEVHGISKNLCETVGCDPESAANVLLDIITNADVLIAHNNKFDNFLFEVLLIRLSLDATSFREIPKVCTMMTTTDYCNLPGRYGKPKWPKLSELHQFLFGEDFTGAHDALADVRALRRCYYELQTRGVL